MPYFWGPVLAGLMFCAAALTVPASALASDEPSLHTYNVSAEALEQARAAIAPLLSSEARISQLDAALLVLGGPADHAIVRQVLGSLGIETPQYTVTVIEGASRSQARKLLSGDRQVQSYTVRGKGNQARISSVRVTAGEPAALARSETRQRVSSAWSGRRESGVTLTPERTGSQVKVHATPRGQEVEIMLENFRSERVAADPASVAASELNTTVIVPLDKWVAIGDIDALTSGTRKTYGTAAAFDQTLTLLRVSRIN